MKKRGGAGQRNVVENGEVEVPFLGLERRGGSRWEELDGGRGVRFEVGRFEDEGDMVRRWFIGKKEGGRAALRFGSLCAEEGAASGGARCGKADWAGGGGSGGGRRWLPKVGWAGVAGWAKCHLGRRGEKTKKKEREIGRKDDWAEMILGCVEKKKKVFIFWFKEWYSNLNFQYLQTKFELDF
jgi:hypothetical protein